MDSKMRKILFHVKNKLWLLSSILGELEWIRLSKLQPLLLEPHSSNLFEDSCRKESLIHS